MNNFLANLNKIFETLKQYESNLSLKNQIRKPKMSDLELIAVDLTAEYMSIDSERQLFRILPQEISSRIERSVYNKRRRALFYEKQRLQQAMAEYITGDEIYYLVDSMPLEVCKLSRASRSKICKENEHTFPDKGYCASQSMYYYGYKLHATCSVTGVFKSFDLSAASIHDIHYLKDIKCLFESCVIIGDKGYLSADYQLDLFTSNQIRLEVPMRRNQHDYKPYPAIFKKSRKRIETLFSQLCDQFMIRRNYAKTFDGFKTRILSKITSLTVIQLINKLLNRNINNLKICIA
jgi:hypothetical protein